jgi:hypothetical protein
MFESLMVQLFTKSDFQATKLLEKKKGYLTTTKKCTSKYIYVFLKKNSVDKISQKNKYT